jgi:hypothetical protein
LKKITKAALLSSLSLSLLVAPTLSFAAESKTPTPKITQQSELPVNEQFAFTHEGITYDVKTIDTKKSLIVLYKSEKGTEKHEVIKTTGEVTATSDYLSKKELKDIEHQVKTGSVKTDKQSIAPLSSIAAAPSAYAIDEPMDYMVGSWVWSNWYNQTISFADKATVTAVTTLLLSQIPYIGAVASSMATVLIAYGMKTGYFKVRGASALDSDPSYGWMKKTVNAYTSSARTSLIKSETSAPVQVRMY